MSEVSWSESDPWAEVSAEAVTLFGEIGTSAGTFNGEASITITADYFAEIVEVFERERRRVQVFDNMAALVQAQNLLQGAYNGPRIRFNAVEVRAVEGGAPGQCFLRIQGCSCGETHEIKTQGELDDYRQHIWALPARES